MGQRVDYGGSSLAGCCSHRGDREGQGVVNRRRHHGHDGGRALASVDYDYIARAHGNLVRGGTAYGRDHNPNAMTLWLAGGGCNAGHTIGATDELGMVAVEDKAHIRDFHVTLLRLLGLDDNKLTYYHAGRFKQLSQFGGQVIQKLVA